MEHIHIDKPVEDGLGALQIYTLVKDDQTAAATETAAATDTQRNANDNFYELWDKFYKPPPPKTPKVSLDIDIEGKPRNPSNVNEDGAVSKINAVTSYEQAAENCKAKVDAIVKECKRLNRKYYDRNFDFSNGFSALEYLGAANPPTSIVQFSGIGDVKRVDEIFENPKFMEDGATAANIRQGTTGDCWFLAALTALGGTEELDASKRLLTKLCVARNEQAGVYGFVFYRDGEWISEVIDDRLPLKTREGLQLSLATYRKDQVYQGKKCDVITTQKLPKEIQESLGKGADALYFSSCKESEETWLPLIEKAYAKVHGNYQSIDSGYPGEGIEDLTGGVNTQVDTEDLLDKDQLWNELLEVNKSFLFGCSSTPGTTEDTRNDIDGIVTNHAYSVMAAREIEVEVKGKQEKVRLVKVRNPWAYQEWTGAWSDGSKEWTPEAMKELNHRFGDDGIFWITFKDFLKYFPSIDRTRLFGPEWTVSSQWTCVNVPWDAKYLDTKFTVQVDKAGPVVIVLCQPDTRFFKGLVGRYTHYLHYRLYKDGEETYLIRSMCISGSSRSCSAELDLEPGSYTVHIKSETVRNSTAKTAEEIIRQYRLTRTDEILDMGKRFDMAHSKGLLREMEQANKERTKREKKQEARDKDINQQKKRRIRKQEERRREKAKKKRIADEIKKKKAEKKASKQAAKEAAEAVVAPKPAAETATATAAANAEESRRSSSAGILTPETTPPTSTTSSQKDGEEDGKSAPSQEATAAPPESTDKTTVEPEKAETPPADKAQEDSSSDKAAVQAEPENDSSVTPPDESTVHIVPKPEEESKPSTEIKEASSGEKDEQVAKEEGEAKEKPADTTNDANNVEKSTAKEQVAETQAATSTKTEQKKKIEPEEDDDDDVGSVKDEDFDWDSDIDGPVEKEEAATDDSDDMFANDPWRAVCTVGLRVYSLDAQVKIGVVGSAIKA